MTGTATDISRRLRVLLVDDIQVHHDLLETGIEIFNPFTKIDHASTVEDAIGKLHRHAYSAVIVDWDACGGGGEALVNWLRARANFQKVACIVVLTQTYQESTINAFLEQKVDAYVVKPFKRLELFEKMMRAVQKRHSETVL